MRDRVAAVDATSFSTLPTRNEALDQRYRGLDMKEKQDRPSNSSQKEFSELEKLLDKAVFTERAETTSSDELLPLHDPANPVSFVIGQVRYSFPTKEEAIASFLQKVDGLPEGEYDLDNGRKTRSKEELKAWIRNL
jgi:hypothetical protein